MSRSQKVMDDPVDVAREPTPIEAVFAAERARLVGLAYRITGSRLDAEDVVQEAWLRAQRVDGADLDRPEAWFTRVVSRLALDHLKSARRRRETYVGPWLPEPVRTLPVPRPRAGVTPGAVTADDDPAELAAVAESLTFGFLRLLETLGPAERVVFLLADVFDTPYDEIAAVVDRTPEACRQLASRARRRVRSGNVRHDLPDDAQQVVGELLAAVAAGDVDQVISLMADDIVVVSDGGARTYTARRPVVGSKRAARYMVNLAQRWLPRVDVELMAINGESGLVMRLRGHDELFLALAVQVSDGRAVAVHLIRNPDKLAALDLAPEIL
jgi:RNA polymerase sigma-70 factor (ECF subfamily)